MTTDTQRTAFRFLQDIAGDLSKREITFPTFANATLKVRRALDDPGVDAERISRVIMAEPLLAAKVVRIANSAAVNPGGKPVNDVKTAVTRVGLIAVRTDRMRIEISVSTAPRCSRSSDGAR